MRSLSLAPLVLALAVAGCDSAPAIDLPPAPSPVLPLAVGTEWTLAQTTTVRYDDAGAVEDTSEAGAGRALTLTVARDTVVAGETWYFVETTGPAGHSVFDGASWFANRGGGLYRWQESPEDAERVYAIGVPEGEPFLVTPLLTAVLTDDDAQVEVGSETVVARQYDRTFRRLEFSETVRGPIDPNAASRDQLSPTEGPVTLEIAYVRQVAEGQFAPVMRVAYEATAGAASGRVPRVRPGTYAVR